MDTRNREDIYRDILSGCGMLISGPAYRLGPAVITGPSARVEMNNARAATVQVLETAATRREEAAPPSWS
jgi:hypothetical protein